MAAIERAMESPLTDQDGTSVYPIRPDQGNPGVNSDVPPDERALVDPIAQVNNIGSYQITALRYGAFVIAPCLAYRVKIITDQGRSLSGDYIILMIKFYLYFLTSLYTIFYPVYYCLWKRKTEKKRYHPLTSLSLRMLCLFPPLLVIVYNWTYWHTCSDSDALNFTELKETCSWRTTIERFLGPIWHFGLGVFIMLNGYYPRKTRLEVMAMIHVCSSAIYGYLVNLVFEEILIYEEIEERIHTNHTNISYFFNDEYTTCSGYWDCVIRGYLEFFYVMVSEYQLVAISISMAIIKAAGRTDPIDVRFQVPWGKGIFLFGVVSLIFFGTGAILYAYTFHKADPATSTTKVIFNIAHIVSTFLGTLCYIVLYFLRQKKDDLPAERNPPHDPQHAESRKVELGMLNFGHVFTFFYIGFGLVQSFGLLANPDYADFNAGGSIVVNLLSWLQIWLQTMFLESPNIETNLIGCITLTFLLAINAFLFIVNIFDASTLGIVANTILPGTNILWAMMVRGLAVFDVFYRFHSMAMLSEMVEKIWEEYCDQGGNGSGCFIIGAWRRLRGYRNL